MSECKYVALESVRDALLTLKNYCTGRTCRECALRIGDHPDSYCGLRSDAPVGWDILEITPPKLLGN